MSFTFNSKVLISGILDSIGVSDWIMIALGLIFLSTTICFGVFASRALAEIRRQSKQAVKANISIYYEIVDDFCCLVLENTGKTLATNVNVNANSQFLSTYKKATKVAKKDNVFRILKNKKGLTIAPSQKLYYKIFDIYFIEDYRKGKLEKLKKLRMQIICRYQSCGSMFKNSFVTGLFAVAGTISTRADGTVIKRTRDELMLEILEKQQELNNKILELNSAGKLEID
ncbi:MAG: hypothetical protein RR123_00355 [Clostridia bacterium]